MHPTLGFGKPAQDGDRLFCRSGVQSGRLYQSCQIGESDRVIMVMRMALTMLVLVSVLVFLVVLMVVVVRMDKHRTMTSVWNQSKPAYSNAATYSLAQHRLSTVPGKHNRQIVKNTLLQIREGVEQGRNKHVACQTTAGIQMDVMVFRHDCQKPG
jgi:hypothetical protein